MLCSVPWSPNYHQFTFRSIHKRYSSKGSLSEVQNTLDRPITSTTAPREQVLQVLYLLDRFGVGDSFYHEFAMATPSLPRSHHIKAAQIELNQSVEIHNIPGFPVIRGNSERAGGYTGEYSIATMYHALVFLNMTCMHLSHQLEAYPDLFCPGDTIRNLTPHARFLSGMGKSLQCSTCI